MIRSLLRTLPAVLVLGLAVSLVGCKSDDAGVPTTQAAVSMGAVNGSCPIMSDNKVDPNATTASYNGATVGFCCGNCINKWNTWSDTQKSDFVASAQK